MQAGYLVLLIFFKLNITYLNSTQSFNETGEHNMYHMT